MGREIEGKIPSQNIHGACVDQPRRNVSKNFLTSFLGSHYYALLTDKRLIIE